MLDSRTSLPTERAQRVPGHAKGASLLDALATRPTQPDDLSFGSVLSNTLSDRRATPRAQERAAVADAASPAQSRQAARRKAAQRDRWSDAKDEAADQAALSQSRRTDGPDRNDPAPADAQTFDAAQQSAIVATSGEAAAQSLATAITSSDPATGSEQSAAALGQSLSAKPASAGLTPLQWMAQQQVAKLNVRTAQARAAIPVQSGSTDKQAPDSEAAAPGKQAAPAAAPAVQQLMVDLLGPGKPAADALGVLKLSQGQSDDSQSVDPAATAATQGLANQGHSLTADPAGLLYPSDGSTFAAVSQAHSPPSPAHAAAGPPAGGQQPNAALLVPDDDSAVRNMQRLAAMVHAKMGQGQSIARMQLQPPELGAVTAVIQLRQNKMDLKLEVANEAARDLVTDGLGRLRDSLQQQGISLDRATVSVAPRNEHPTGDQQQPAWTDQQDQPSGQFHPGQGDQQSDRDFTTSFAMDVPAGAVPGQEGVAAAATLHAAGLNVLA